MRFSILVAVLVWCSNASAQTALDERSDIHGTLESFSEKWNDEGKEFARILKDKTLDPHEVDIFTEKRLHRSPESYTGLALKALFCFIHEKYELALNILDKMNTATPSQLTGGTLMTFEEKLAEHYQKIADHLNAMVPVEWTKIAMLGMDAGASRSGVFYFFTPDGKHHRSHDEIRQEYSVSNELYKSQLYRQFDLVHDLRQEFIDAGQPPWCGISFILTSDGKFEIDFEYGIYDEVGSTTAEYGWRYLTLGIQPRNDFEKSVLDDYLAIREAVKAKQK